MDLDVYMVESRTPFLIGHNNLSIIVIYNSYIFIYFSTYFLF